MNIRRGTTPLQEPTELPALSERMARWPSTSKLMMMSRFSSWLTNTELGWTRLVHPNTPLYLTCLYTCNVQIMVQLLDTSNPPQIYQSPDREPIEFEVKFPLVRWPIMNPFTQHWWMWTSFQEFLDRDDGGNVFSFHGQDRKRCTSKYYFLNGKTKDSKCLPLAINNYFINLFNYYYIIF